MRRNKNAAESGSVVIYILLGVILLGMLYYMASRSGQSSNIGTLGNTKVQAQQIIDYGKTVEARVQKILTVNGYSERQLSFANSGNASYVAVDGCASDNCTVFGATPGGVRYMTPPASWLDTSFAGSPQYGLWYFPKTVCVANVGTGGIACQSDPISVRDIVIYLFYVKKSVCMQINNILGVPNPSGAPPVNGTNVTHTTYPLYNGNFSGTTGKVGPATAPNITSGCILSAGSPSAYIYFDVLQAR